MGKQLIMKFYGIRNKKTKRALGFSCSSNGDAEFSNDIAYELEGFTYDTQNVWLINKREIAERVFKEQTKWYNASYCSPMIGDPYFSTLEKEYEIFEVEI